MEAVAEDNNDQLLQDAYTSTQAQMVEYPYVACLFEWLSHSTDTDSESE